MLRVEKEPIAVSVLSAERDCIAREVHGAGVGRVINRLLDIGFECAGRWSLENGRIRYQLTRHASRSNVLYAFVEGSEVKYVGKTSRSLSARMDNYVNPGPTQATNTGNRRRIEDVLLRGATVEIYAFVDSRLLQHGGFHVNLAPGLEDDIIRVLKPSWNGSPDDTVLQEPAPEAATPVRVTVAARSADEVTTLQAPAAKARSSAPVKFTFRLQPTYFRMGFFNVGVDQERYFAADGDTIEIQLGTNTQRISGTINRRANANGTPRILGNVDLKNWFSGNLSVDQLITVEVFNSRSIRLSAGKP